MLILKKDNYIIIKYKQKPKIYISSFNYMQTSKTSAILAKTLKCSYLLSAPPHLSLLEKVLVPSIKSFKSPLYNC